VAGVSYLHPPHFSKHSEVHSKSHAVVQQYWSIPQTQASHAHPPHPGYFDVEQPGPVMQVPPLHTPEQ
jgi:hypothetical protein